VISIWGARQLVGNLSSRIFNLWAQLEPSTIIEKLDLEKPSFWPLKWPQKLKTAKNSKLPKLSKTYFELVGKGGRPLIST
jgi:hypothetical protein